jgi:hypothetical protein
MAETLSLNVLIVRGQSKLTELIEVRQNANVGR